MTGSSTDPKRIYPVLRPQLRRDFPLLRSLEAMPKTSPQNLPVESLSRAELAMDLKTAQEIGLTISQAVGCAPMRSFNDRSVEQDC
jgi:hypothetical protein